MAETNYLKLPLKGPEDTSQKVLDWRNEINGVGDSSAFAKLDAAIERHETNEANPHHVTKDQLGLGNVPNVTTNDQTPTYTPATGRTALVSGEKLSVALGKITKWFADLGTLAFKSTAAKSDLASDVQASLGKADTALQNYTETDPTVPAWAKAARKPAYTASEVGLGNVNNTSDASKPISTATQTALNGKVPTTRKVNNKVLSADITLSAADVGAVPTTGGTMTGPLAIGGMRLSWDATAKALNFEVVT